MIIHNIQHFQTSQQPNSFLSQANHFNNKTSSFDGQSQHHSDHKQKHVISKYQFSQSKISSIKNQNINRPPIPKKPKTSVKILKHHYVCDERRQNQLNAKFLKKKSELQIITKQNKNIYKRINSQKSVYSHRSLNKSYQSNRSLMNSRATSRSNKSFTKSNKEKLNSNKTKYISDSEKTYKGSEGLKIRLHSAKLLNKNINNQSKPQSISINSRNITKINNQDIKQFACLFRISQQPKPTHIPKLRSKSAKQINTIKTGQISSKTSSTCMLKPLVQTKLNQIVINQQNQIQLVQQKGLKFQKSALADIKAKVNKEVLRQRSSSTTNNRKFFENIQNINLFQMQTDPKVSGLCQNVQKKLNDNRNVSNLNLKKQNNKFSQIKISKKYTGLMAKISDQLAKIKKLQPRLLQISGKGKNTTSRNTKTLIF